MPSPPYAADLYDRLGIDSSSDARTIRRQYRLLARLYHPDVNASEEAQRQFVALRDAYDILGDEEKKAAYDRWLEEEGHARPVQLEYQLFPSTIARTLGQQRLYLLLNLEAREVREDSHPPLNIVLVLDRSSSMKGERIFHVKQAANQIIEQLTARDIFGLVAFNDRGHVMLPTGYATDKDVARHAVQRIAPAGGTEIASGLRLGLQQLYRHHNKSVISHLILLTDGRTYGDEEDAFELARQAGERGVGITAMGLGTDWNDQFLDTLARGTHGTSHFIDRPERALEIFQTQLQRLQQTFARNARLLLSTKPGVQLLQAHEIAPGIRALPIEQDEVLMGNLPTRPALRLLLEFSVTPPSGGVGLLGEPVLGAEPVSQGDRYRIVRKIVVDVDEVNKERPPQEIIQAAQRVATLRMQERAWQAAEEGEVDQAAVALEQLADRFTEIGETNLASATRQEINHFQQSGTLSEWGRKGIKYGTRMLALPAPGDEEK